MEENLTLQELEQILESQRKVTEAQHRFMAAIQGIDLDKNKKKSSDENPDFEAIKRRAQAKLAGMTEEQVELADIGVIVIDEDEEVD